MSSSVQVPVTFFGQTVEPQTWWTLLSGNSLTVNLGTSTNPAAETDILAAVGSYGHQLGTLGDALRVLLRLVEEVAPERVAQLDRRDRAALAALRDQLAAVDHAKRRHRRPGEGDQRPVSSSSRHGSQ